MDKIWTLALQGNAREQVDAARFLIEAGDFRKAILLFQKAGEHREAVELAIRYEGCLESSASALGIFLSFVGHVAG